MRKYRTADLCDENQDKKIQVLSSSFKNYGGKKRFKGKITTVKIEKSNWAVIDILKNESGKNKILVVDAQEVHYGIIGDKLSNLAEKNEYEAIIVNGYVRDTMETEKFNIGLFALGTCPLRNFDKTPSEVGIDLYFGNVSFKEDDYIYCDEDGIIVSNERLM